MKEDEVSPFDDTWQIDPLTGEILSDVKHQEYLVPIDVKLILSREDYDREVRLRRKRWMKLWISPLLLDVIIERHLTIPAISVMCVLGQKVGYQTMVYTNLKDLVKESGHVRQTVSNALTELKDNGFIREVGNKLKEKDSRFLLLNPLYFFVGYYPSRDKLIREWVDDYVLSISTHNDIMSILGKSNHSP